MKRTSTADDSMKAIEVFDITGDGGILKNITVSGSEPIPQGVTAIINYSGKLIDGTEFDSTSKRGTPLTFKLGRREVILALDLAVATMKKGEKCHLVCKSEYAYGKVKVGPIPPYSTVKYDLELEGWDNPNAGRVAMLPIVTISVFLLLLACIAGSLMG